MAATSGFGIGGDPLQPGNPGAGLVLGHARRVMRVEDVDVRHRREVGVDRDTEHPMLKAVVDVGRDVDERRRQEGAVAIDADHAALLGDEHRSVRREVERHRRLEAFDDRRDLEACGRGGRGGRRPQEGRTQAGEQGEREARAHQTGSPTDSSAIRIPARVPTST